MFWSSAISRSRKIRASSLVWLLQHCSNVILSIFWLFFAVHVWYKSKNFADILQECHEDFGFVASCRISNSWDKVYFIPWASVLASIHIHFYGLEITDDDWLTDDARLSEDMNGLLDISPHRNCQETCTDRWQLLFS